jgi:HD-GYP domain-containing protein (c-di-GMP phosphodiesterase class II)
MESHVTIGHEMLVALPFLTESLPTIRGHHERWDGRGYPDKLGGDDIPVHARLMSVGDSFDAMTSARPYRDAMALTEAARRLRADTGRQFAPEAIEAYDAVEAELHEIRTRLIQPRALRQAVEE